MRHPPTPGGLGSSALYKLSPYSPKQEERIVFAAHNYTPETTAALGEAFMTARVVGRVPNLEVMAALARGQGVALEDVLRQQLDGAVDEVEGVAGAAGAPAAALPARLPLPPAPAARWAAAGAAAGAAATLAAQRAARRRAARGGGHGSPKRAALRPQGSGAAA
jgi:hypothetical protein